MQHRYILWLAACLCIAGYGCTAESENDGSSLALQEGEGPVDDDDGADEGAAGEGGDDDGTSDEGSFPEDLECTQGGASSEIRVEFDCDEIVVYTCKDLSNLVVEYADGTRVKFDGQSGNVNSFSGNGQVVVGVWVKAGANHSGDGPGYGERVDNPVVDCDPGDNDDDDPPGDDIPCDGLDEDCRPPTDDDDGEDPPGDDDGEDPPGDDDGDDGEDPPGDDGDDDGEDPPGDDDGEDPPGDDVPCDELDADCGGDPPSDGDPIDCDETPTDPACIVD